jgi:prepilin-type N-terminal cleavage/methylation domain-containing protein/prepilin-type processing-associated H-X9-DG protein
MHGRSRTLTPAAAFTLIELLIVIAIIAMLIGILLPALGAARKTARAAVCLNSQRQTAIGMHTYAGDHKEIVIPSYNMADVTGASACDGWAPILDRDNYVKAGEQTRATAFYCPETIDVEGLATGQTGKDPLLPKGWMDWPNMRAGSKNSPVLIPERNFNKIIRVSYWINADNPIGSQVPTITPDAFFTGSVGYGPAADGKFIRHTRMSAHKRPSSLIATADGVYAGRQRDNKVNTENCRIGYRHTGAGGGAANVAFADGHASVVTARDFPRGLPSDPKAAASAPAVALALEENSFGKPTVYSDPDKAFDIK